jgi:hypothetical protein
LLRSCIVVSHMDDQKTKETSQRWKVFFHAAKQMGC